MQFNYGRRILGVQHVLFYSFVLFLFFIVILLVKTHAIYGGWAENDATYFHFIIINYFIHSGFNWQYPQLLPMYPGMHVFFALIARSLHVEVLSPTDWTSFAIQSIWGICYLAMALIIALRLRVAAPHVEMPMILLILLSSSYPMASWIWPTTELGAFAMMYGMYALMIGRSPLSIGQACLFAVFALIATLFRQNYAIFAVAPIATYLIGCFGAGEKISTRLLFAAMIPVLAVGVIVVAFTLHWGGLVPAELARHGGAGHVEISQIQNIVALIGLLGLPFIAVSFRILAPNRTALASILVLSLVCAIASELLAPMVYDRDSGHWGSLPWAIVLWGDTRHLHAIPIIIVSAAGWFVCLTILYLSVIERYLAPEIAMLGLLTISLLPQLYVHQRYSEVTIFASLSIFFLSRFEPRGSIRWFIYVWYGAYMTVSLIRPVIALGNLSG